jgi:hypothetical protein
MSLPRVLLLVLSRNTAKKRARKKPLTIDATFFSIIPSQATTLTSVSLHLQEELYESTPSPRT